MKSSTEIIKSSNALSVSNKRPELLPATIAKINALREKYPSLQSLSEVFHPSMANRYSRYPARCVCGTAPSLVDLNNAYGESASVKWLIAQLVSYQEGINTPNKMSPLQYSTLAEKIVQEFHYLKCTDIHLFLTHLAAGSFNVDYHGYVSPDVILDALRHQYIPFRFHLMQKEEEKRQKELEQQEKNTKGITWEEFCRLTGREVTSNPFESILQQFSEPKPEEE